MRVSDVCLCIYLACILAYAIQTLLLEYRNRYLPYWGICTNLLRILPVGSVLISASVIATTFTRKGGSPQCAKDEINPDISGIGVLLGLFIPSIVLGIVLVLGHFTNGTTGAKELCLAHMANVLYLSVNLGKSYRTLNRTDLLVAYSSLDAVVASISMAMSDKDVMAARKILVVASMLKAVAFSIQACIIHHLASFSHICLSEMPHPVTSSPRILIWIFLALRFFVDITLIPTMLRLAPNLDESENASQVNRRGGVTKHWRDLSTTVFTTYLIHTSIAILQGTSALMMIYTSISTSWHMLWNEWGQSAALIVAMVASSHVAYTILHLFHIRFSEQPSYTETSSPRPVGLIAHGLRMIPLTCDWPFGKSGRLPVDDLFVDSLRLLDKNRNLLAAKSEEIAAVWRDWIYSFDLQDFTGMRECLRKDISLNRTSANYEYPIHMAARLGSGCVDILEGTHENSEAGFRRLCARNSDGQTPIFIAYKANQPHAFEKLLELRRDTLKVLGPAFLEHFRGETDQSLDFQYDDICKILRHCIDDNKDGRDDYLRLITKKDLSFNWEGVFFHVQDLNRRLENLPPNDYIKILEYSKSQSLPPFIYALSRHKIWSAGHLLRSHSGPIWRYMDIFANMKTNSSEWIYANLLNHFPQFWTYTTPKILGDWTLKTTCRLILASRNYSLGITLVSSDLKLSHWFLDSLLLGVSPIDRDLEQRLLDKGARNYRKFKRTILSADWVGVQRQLKAESSDEARMRMLNVNMPYTSDYPAFYNSLCLVLNVSTKDPKNHIGLGSTVALMLQFGANVSTHLAPYAGLEDPSVTCLDVDGYLPHLMLSNGVDKVGPGAEKKLYRPRTLGNRRTETSGQTNQWLHTTRQPLSPLQTAIAYCPSDTYLLIVRSVGDEVSLNNTFDAEFLAVYDIFLRFFWKSSCPYSISEIEIQLRCIRTLYYLFSRGLRINSQDHKLKFYRRGLEDIKSQIMKTGLLSWEPMAEISDIIDTMIGFLEYQGGYAENEHTFSFTWGSLEPDDFDELPRPIEGDVAEGTLMIATESEEETISWLTRKNFEILKNCSKHCESIE